MNQKFVICIRNDDYPASLELRKLYQVISDPDAEKSHQLRVIDESGEDYLYPEEYFLCRNNQGRTPFPLHFDRRLIYQNIRYHSRSRCID